MQIMFRRQYLNQKRMFFSYLISLLAFDNGTVNLCFLIVPIILFLAKNTFLKQKSERL